MTTRRKGQVQELRAQRALKEEGWLVERAPPSRKWQTNVDFFGLFDLIALRKKGMLCVRGQGELIYERFIQVKTNRKYTKKEYRALQDFMKNYGHVGMSVEWWIWWERGKRKQKQGWEKLYIT